ncbi:hypothetical protein ACFL2D_01445 [Patescibacteria group bacterium]
MSEGSKIALGVGCTVVGIFMLVVTAGIVLYVIGRDEEADQSSESSVEEDQAKWNYEFVYDYDSIEEPPWLYQEDQLEQFAQWEKYLEENGEEIDEEFYKEVLEVDVQELLNQDIEKEIGE